MYYTHVTITQPSTDQVGALQARIQELEATLVSFQATIATLEETLAKQEALIRKYQALLFAKKSERQPSPPAAPVAAEDGETDPPPAPGHAALGHVVAARTLLPAARATPGRARPWPPSL